MGRFIILLYTKNTVPVIVAQYIISIWNIFCFVSKISKKRYLLRDVNPFKSVLFNTNERAGIVRKSLQSSDLPPLKYAMHVLLMKSSYWITIYCWKLHKKKDLIEYTADRTSFLTDFKGGGGQFDYFFSYLLPLTFDWVMLF